MPKYIIIPGLTVTDDMVDDPRWAEDPLSVSEPWLRYQTPEAVRVTAERLEKELRGAA